VALVVRHARLIVIAVALVATLAAAFLWLRDSSLVQVRNVDVVGVSSSEGQQVKDALRSAALEMTTLDVHADQLRDAVSGFSSVAGIRVQPHFPHDLTIEVTERQPVAAVDIGGEEIPVGAGGRLMRGVRAGGLPAIKALRFAPGDRLADPQALAEVGLLAEAPEALRAKVARAYSGPKGLTLDLRAGPSLYFGADTDIEAKWKAAAAVLAAPAAAGAVYLDLRVPDRVAAGGLGTLPQDAADPLALNPQAQASNPQPQPENSPSLNP
jgi:cell division protein FtsQ